MGDASMMDLSCTEFSERLAAKASVPGGGGAAALAAALGVALGTMAGNFTLGKPRYAQVEPQVRELVAGGERIRGRLLALVDEDAAAFAPLSRAYGIPRDDPSRASVLEEATKGAIEPPLQMMREIARAIDLLEDMERVGSKMLASDVGCGAALCAAALEAAAMNVFVNTKALRDRAHADAVNRECAALLRGQGARARAIAGRVMDGLRGER